MMRSVGWMDGLSGCVQCVYGERDGRRGGAEE